jgi:hypothetical protein
MRRAKTSTIEQALRILSRDIVSDDGVASAACIEAANRLAEMRELLDEAKRRCGETWPSPLARAVNGVLT